MNAETPSAVEQGYDAVYAAWPKAATLHRIWREQVIGADYPDGFEHISFASPSELHRLTDALRVRDGEQLVDLACGAGGSGLWVAQATNTHLMGIDFSAVGLELARQRATTLGIAAHFAKGSLSETGLPDNSMNAAMTLDALQYAPSKLDAMREVFRVLKPGGMFACYSFVLDTAKVADLPGAWQDPVEDLREPMRAAGLDVFEYATTDRWLERLTSAYSAVVAARDSLLTEIGERATNALLFEMTLTLDRKPYRDRIFAAARKP